jgi:hypothetical protein
MNILFLLILCALKRDMSGMRVNITALLKPITPPVEITLLSKKHFNNFVEIKVEQVPYTSAFEKNKMFLLLPTLVIFIFANYRGVSNMPKKCYF